MESRSCRAFVSVLLGAFVISALAHAAPVRKKIAVKAGRIITISAAEIKNGVILIEDGIIKAIGKDLEIPWDAFVIEAGDKVVMPGFVLAHTSNGLDRANENLPEVPFLSTFESIDPIIFLQDEML